MEKFQIAKYGMMQVTALVYGILICSLGIKMARLKIEQGVAVPSSYYFVLFMHDYGFLLLIAPICWVALTAYYSEEDAPWWARVALANCLLLVIGCSSISLGLLVGVFK